MATRDAPDEKPFFDRTRDWSNGHNSWTTRPIRRRIVTTLTCVQSP